MVYATGLAMGFNEARWDVRKANEKVWRFMETLGGVRTHEDNNQFYYAASENAMLAAIKKARYNPEIAVVMPEGAPNHYGNPGYVLAC